MESKYSFLLHVFHIAYTLPTSVISQKKSSQIASLLTCNWFFIYYTYKFYLFDQLTFPLGIKPDSA